MGPRNEPELVEDISWSTLLEIDLRAILGHWIGQDWEGRGLDCIQLGLEHLCM